MSASVELGIIGGQGDNAFHPQGKASRAEALNVVLNMLNLNPEIKTLLDSLN